MEKQDMFYFLADTSHDVEHHLPFPLWILWISVFSLFVVLAFVFLSYRNVGSTHFDPTEEDYARELLDK